MKNCYCLIMLLVTVSFGADHSKPSSTDEIKLDIIGKEFRNENEFGPMFKRMGGGVVKEPLFVSFVKVDALPFMILKQLLRNDGKSPIFSVLSYKAIPPYPDSLILAWGHCRKNKMLSDYIIAIVNPNEDAEYYSQITKAWRVDTVHRLFVPIPTDGIDCLNGDYGEGVGP